MSKEIQALALLLLILGVAWLGYVRLFGGGGGERLVIAAVEGTVRRVDGYGAEIAAEPGLALQPRDRIVAGAGGRAVLALGPDSRVTIEEESAVRVLAADASGVKLELEGGRVQATIRPGAGPVGISSEGTSLIADDADFTVVRGEDGTLGVIAERGQVGIEGLPGTERLSAGERLVAARGGTALVAPVSEELLLKVAWPNAARTREETTEVRGHTEPNARVRLGRAGAWVEVKADPTGDFVTRVRLAEGANEIHVEATSVLGTSIAVVHTVVRDTTAPSVSTQIRY
ncbi:MAG: FecR domain-containing protein [Pseudomonadota bacterium]|nr:FecR domain-containing protein [Pseudomonadota bacterium]